MDVSHVSKAAALEAMRVSRAPVIASHSSSRALADHPRNVDDETLLALRDNGGVVQVVALDDFLKIQPPGRAEAMAELEEAVGYQGSTEGMSHEQKIEYDRGLEDIDLAFPPADVSDFVDHIDHVVQLVGIDHVGISSDFDGGGGVHGWAARLRATHPTSPQSCFAAVTPRRRSRSCGAAICCECGAQPSGWPPRLARSTDPPRAASRARRSGHVARPPRSPPGDRALPERAFPCPRKSSKKIYPRRAPALGSHPANARKPP